MNKINDIRKTFINMYKNCQYTDDGMLEILNASFIADENVIFGKLNKNYLECETKWYMSKSLNINDMQCKIPKIWKKISDKNGYINSNYGWCIFSNENYNQFDNAINSLLNNKNSRHGTMIYIRPTIHKDAFKNNMKDFICTYTAQLFIRNNKLEYLVYMRSNDIIYGYKNDKYWHDLVFNMAIKTLNCKYKKLIKGNMYWNVASLHMYPINFNLIDKIN